MVQHLDRFVIGQTEAKEVLAAAVYRHYLGLAVRDGGCRDRHPFGHNTVLLVGPSGSGKSFLVTCLADYLGVPYSFSSAKNLVEVGYVGQQVDSVLKNLWMRAGQDVACAERGIVFIDEFDKLRKVPGPERDISGEGVQNSLLTLLDGRPTTVRVEQDRTVEIDTSRVLFILAGAFVGLTELVRQRLGNDRRIGFGRG